MRDISCVRCGRPPQPPLTVERSRLPTGWLASATGRGHDGRASYPFCHGCLQALRQDEPCCREVERRGRAGEEVPLRGGPDLLPPRRVPWPAADREGRGQGAAGLVGPGQPPCPKGRRAWSARRTSRPSTERQWSRWPRLHSACLLLTSGWARGVLPASVRPTDAPSGVASRTVAARSAFMLPRPVSGGTAVTLGP